MSDDGLRHDELGDACESLSAFADGEADAAEQLRCLMLWRTQRALRVRWHEYQVIGDAMRSDELVSRADDDAAFLDALRDRLTHDQPAMAPVIAAAPRRMPAWLGPMAVAAGVGAVALTLALLGPLRPGPSNEASLAAAPPKPTNLAVAAPAEPALRVLSGQLIRDARLDRYLAAHRQGANGAALQMPGAVVRSVDTIVLESK